ncbi:transporter substrate-binding domain-containing protein [Labrenzia sp. DG1229]|uniref:substrate-binding periplasmic protein n=1 Tax=Labrenzia sp. DG1229 TaxID=681847 RepID=UPI00048CC978|nr:transporter substrate-binding domain-containing protein [Labrenzia sp. DG1229]
MRLIFYVLFFSILYFAAQYGALADEPREPELVVYTEDYKPFYYLGDNGEPAGSVTELVRTLADRAGIRLKIHLRPFRRGLNAVNTNKNHCFMALWRTAAREPDFNWVGPLQIDGFAFFALEESDISLSKMEDSFPYATGTVGGWTSTLAARKAGHPNLVLVDDDALNLNMLKQGRTQLWLGGLLSAPYVAGEQGVSIKNVFTVEEVDLSLACNRATDTSLTDRLQAALDAHTIKGSNAASEKNPIRLTQ